MCGGGEPLLSCDEKVLVFSEDDVERPHWPRRVRNGGWVCEVEYVRIKMTATRKCATCRC